MQPFPFPFVPWVWRNVAELLDKHDTDSPEAAEATESAERRHRPDIGLLGYEVEAIDGPIGEIDQSNARVPADCLLVDAGTWLSPLKVVLPVGAVAKVDHDAKKVYVDRTKEQVQHAPEYDPDGFDASDYRQRLGNYYTESYRNSPPA
ncbi:PRC-barrel domain containing protein [Saccharothrix deserti]|uniref:PRC-barrel domain containing protein n=1 Tax=Saccharothrix deserti TaxID=2593674 RepID=UPI00131BB47A|nr:PRC-barrel domain containing protein [Saccharothrix deserti]